MSTTKQVNLKHAQLHTHFNIPSNYVPNEVSFFLDSSSNRQYHLKLFKW